MKSKIFRFLIILSILTQGSSIIAQEGAAGGAEGGAGGEGNNFLQESIQDLSVVAAAGIGGAILGLSTLSFASKPKERLSNILVGGAIGVIVGVGYIAWKQATKGHEKFGDIESGGNEEAAANFTTQERVHSISAMSSFKTSSIQSPTGWSLTFSF